LKVGKTKEVSLKKDSSMSKPPFSAQKALKAVNVSQMIEGYKPVDKKEVKDQVKKILSHK
jgi:hypothetical protein